MQDIPKRAARFLSDDDGAIAVDLVILTGAIASLGLATLAVVSGGVDDPSGDASNALMEVDPDETVAGSQATAATDSPRSLSHREDRNNAAYSSDSDPVERPTAILASLGHARADVNQAASASGQSHNAIDQNGEPHIAVAAQGSDIPDTGTTDPETREAQKKVS